MGDVSRRKATKGAVWSLPVLGSVVAAPVAVASAKTWEITTSTIASQAIAFDQICYTVSLVGAGADPVATTVNFSASNSVIAYPTSASVSSPGTYCAEVTYASAANVSSTNVTATLGSGSSATWTGAFIQDYGPYWEWLNGGSTLGTWYNIPGLNVSQGAFSFNASALTGNKVGKFSVRYGYRYLPAGTIATPSYAAPAGYSFTVTETDSPNTFSLGVAGTYAPVSAWSYQSYSNSSTGTATLTMTVSNGTLSRSVTSTFTLT